MRKGPPWRGEVEKGGIGIQPGCKLRERERDDCTVVRILEALLGPGRLGTWVGRFTCSGLSDAVSQKEACSLVP